jgi:hypothetical protein
MRTMEAIGLWAADFLLPADEFQVTEELVGVDDPDD